MTRIIRTGCDCVLWNGKRVKRGETVSIEDSIAELLISREPDDWKPEPPAKTAIKE